MSIHKIKNYKHAFLLPIAAKKCSLRANIQPLGTAKKVIEKAFGSAQRVLEICGKRTNNTDAYRANFPIGCLR
jgi:hypothetical protein